MKHCSNCKELKKYSEFSNCAQNPDGLQYRCKPCSCELSKTISSRFTRSRQRAKDKKVSWTITLEDFEWLCNLDCYYCEGSFGKVTKGSGLDRIDPKLGYIFQNVVACCTVCNRLKSDFFSLEDTKFMVDALKKHKGILSGI